MLANQIMTRSPVCVTTRTRLKDAIDVMYANDVRHIPVLDHERLVGILSERDLRSLWESALDPNVSDGRLYERTVSDVMTASPLTAEADADVDEVIETLIEHRIGALPVVDAEGVLVGIISYVDVLRAAIGKL